MAMLIKRIDPLEKNTQLAHSLDLRMQLGIMGAELVR